MGNNCKEALTTKVVTLTIFCVCLSRGLKRCVSCTVVFVRMLQETIVLDNALRPLPIVSKNTNSDSKFEFGRMKPVGTKSYKFKFLICGKASNLRNLA